MKDIERIALDTARELLDFRGNSEDGKYAMSEAMAKEQLEGAVAIHNILAREKFAYLADEVGMGKTFVALGAVALLRYFHPDLRVLYIAPRENIQTKWLKELRNFTRGNWRATDLRVRGYRGEPIVSATHCDSLFAWARRVVKNVDGDLFLRLTSFSFGLSEKKKESWAAKRDELVELAPMIDREKLYLHDKAAFKEAYAKAINTLLPHYDLVVIDEAHNLKHGLQSHSARNRLLSLVLGSVHPEEGKGWSEYGKRFDRVLFLSATPLESDYAELFRQLDLFGFGAGEFGRLSKEEVDLEDKRAIVKRFLVRRLTGLTIGDEVHTKNMYRREWRAGGCAAHDHPLACPDERQALIVALVQKKVAEVLQDPKFGASFQIGMLASFESFFRTAKVGGENEDAAVFDGAEQADDATEKEGIDTLAINRLADSYGRAFPGQTMPHPKMDAVVASLKDCFSTGEKALVFVRRQRSVPELGNKLRYEYDRWLLGWLIGRLPAEVHEDLRTMFRRYGEERDSRKPKRPIEETPEAEEHDEGGEKLFVDRLAADDHGGNDTFFAWFFRGDGPEGGVLSGAAFRKNRLQGERSPYSTLFEDNYVLSLLDEHDVVGALSRELERPLDAVGSELRRRAYAFAKQHSKQETIPRLRAYEAYQVAALSALARSKCRLAREARTILLVRFPEVPEPRDEVPPRDFPEPGELLATKTFFTELRRRPRLCTELWPIRREGSPRMRFRERELRRELLSAVIRLGHAFLDLWVLAIRDIGSMRPRAGDRVEGRAEKLIDAFLDRLEEDRERPGFHAYRELFEVATHHDLLVRVNSLDAPGASLADLRTILGRELGSQTPVGGMYGGVNKRLVKQFRMPGYPIVLITTDVLKEGEDLHTFCSKIIHYGIGWTPSEMEQRTGRVDRIGSAAHRRLDHRKGPVSPDELLQVQYPHLRETVEVLQVERVYERMNRFVRTMHHTFAVEEGTPKLHAPTEFVRTRRDIAPIQGKLETAFPVANELLIGLERSSETHEKRARHVATHLRMLAAELQERLRAEWVEQDEEEALFGTVFRHGEHLLAPEDRRDPGQGGVRRQPIALYLRPAPFGGRILLHVTSPIGFVRLDDEGEALRLAQLQGAIRRAKLCVIDDENAESYTVTVEGDLWMDPKHTQVEELVYLLSRVAVAADMAEIALLPHVDAGIAAFRDDLRREVRRGED